MMWSYLTNSESSNPKLLTFESVDTKDLESLAKGYCELVIVDFFSSFSSNYNAIFISEFGPNSSPQNHQKLFEIKFDDKDVSKKYIKEK